MITTEESFFLSTCLFEGIFFGLYSGVFIMYLRCPSNKSRTTVILFYTICLLYFLSAVTLVCDLVTLIIITRVRKLPLQLQYDQQDFVFRITLAQTTFIGCCDILSQCIMIYRCWIVWGQNIRVVIIPSFLVIVFTATWFGSDASTTFGPQGEFENAAWGPPVIITGLAASMAVNTLVTGLIVFKILKVFLEVRGISGELTLSSLSSTGGGTKLRHILFVIIESGMLLFVTQLIRIVLVTLPPFPQQQVSINFISVINQMLNGITPTIILVRVSMKLSFDDNDSFRKATESLLDCAPKSDPNTFQQMENCSSTLSERRSESLLDCTPKSDPNTLQQMENCSSTLSERRSESLLDCAPKSDPNTLQQMENCISTPSERRSEDTC